MKSSHTKLGLIVLSVLAFMAIFSYFSSNSPKTFTYEFKKTLGIKTESDVLERIVSNNLKDVDGSFAVYIQGLGKKNGKKGFAWNEKESFSAASLYKLIVMAAIMKEVEEGPPAGGLTLETPVSATKTYLTKVLGDVDYGYEDAPEYLEYTVEEALKRVAEVSDNFAAIMLTQKLRQLREEREDEGKLLIEMTKELGMNNTSFDADPSSTTAEDIATYFKLLYQGKVVSSGASQKIIDLLSGSQLNNRIPAKLPKEVKVAHKTGELAGIRHDAGIVYLQSKEPVHLEDNPYVIVLMSKDLKYEDDGIEALANISKEVYEYFKDESLK